MVMLNISMTHLTTKRKLRKLLVRTQTNPGVQDWAFALFHDLMPTTPESCKLLDELLKMSGPELSTMTIYNNTIYQIGYRTHNLQTGNEWKEIIK
jgi:hypothetical protein